MEHKLTITLPDAIYQPLIEAALKEGCTPEEFVVEQVAQAVPVRATNGEPREKSDITQFFGVGHAHEARHQLSAEERAQAKARLRRHAGAVSSGDLHSADNERIDADLAREYGDTHEDEN